MAVVFWASLSLSEIRLRILFMGTGSSALVPDIVLVGSPILSAAGWERRDELNHRFRDKRINIRKINQAINNVLFTNRSRLTIIWNNNQFIFYLRVSNNL